MKRHMARNLSRRQALTLMGGTTAALSLPAQAQTKPPRKIGFLLNGTPGEVGWNYEHMRGIETARRVFGDAVQIDVFTDIGEMGNGDSDKLLELAIDGYDLVFATAAGYGQSLMQIALSAPNTRFEHCGGFVSTANMATYSARWYEGRMPQGIIAGAVTQTNRIGYLASFQTPKVIRGINAAYLAAKSVNPDVAFDVIWVNSVHSPDIEDATTRLLIRGGADVVISDTQSIRPTEVAEALGVFAFGQNSDMQRFGPNAALPATVNNWGPYYVDRITALLEDRWTSGDTWGGFAQGMIEMAPMGANVPAQAADAAQAAIAMMRDGRGGPFIGPVRRQDGTLWLHNGALPSDPELLDMRFFVEGMTTVTG